MSVTIPAMKALVLGLCAATVLSAGLSAQDDFWAEELAAGHGSLLRGKLSEAREIFEDVLASFEEDPADERPDAATARRARQGLLELDLMRGDYDEVRDAVLALPAADRRDPAYRSLLARALQSRGEYGRAIDLWRELVERDEQDLVAAYHLGHLLAETGETDAAHEVWGRVAEAEEQPEDALSLAFLGRCLVGLGGRTNIERASQVFVRSIGADGSRPEARTSLGQLYFRVYNESSRHESGEGYLKKVLRENGEVEEALVALYRLRKANFMLRPDETEGYLQRALSLNPNSVAALSERGIGLLQDRQFEAAAHFFDRALEVNPNAKWVLAHRGATALFMNEREREAGLRVRAFAVDAGFHEYDRIVGDHLVALYRFADAVPYYQRALAAGGDSVEAMHGLAKAMIYTGRGDEAVAVLRRAAELQQGIVHPWRKNALAVEELLAEEYSGVERDGFVFVMHEDDLEVLGEYLYPMYREAREVLGAKYGHVPPEPVKVEVFHTWDDFSVRTIGFRGFAALGACFGRFITLVSPSDELLRQQDFMWAATVWHEYVHVLTLALSNHRVPRWLTEGFSVYEERQRDRSWERGMDRELFDAYHNGEIVPLLQLNRLFRGPRILFGYFQGGLIVEYLSEKHGFDKVIELLQGYGEDRPAEELFRTIFGTSTEDFDRRFLAWVFDTQLRRLDLVPRFSGEGLNRILDRLAANPNDLDARVNLGWAYVQRDNTIDAGNQLRMVLSAEPEHPEGQLLHAELLRRRGEFDAAKQAYLAGFDAGADDFDSRVRFGAMLQDNGDFDGALEQYQRAKACWPQCTDQGVAPNLLLAQLLQKLDRKTEAMMELKAFVQRTGRAFRPRIELAAMERDLGNRAEEAALLEQAVWIDPFMRELHVSLGDAYEELGRTEEALREFRVALAVQPQMDRAHLGMDPGQIPDRASVGERGARAGICLRIARLHWKLGNQEDAFHFLDRVEGEAPDGDSAETARELRHSWGR